MSDLTHPDCGTCGHAYEYHRDPAAFGEPSCEFESVESGACNCPTYSAPLGPRGMGYPTESIDQP